MLETINKKISFVEAASADSMSSGVFLFSKYMYKYASVSAQTFIRIYFCMYPSIREHFIIYIKNKYLNDKIFLLVIIIIFSKELPRNSSY